MLHTESHFVKFYDSEIRIFENLFLQQQKNVLAIGCVYPVERVLNGMVLG